MGPCSPSWFETAQGRLLTMRVFGASVNQGLVLTNGRLGTSLKRLRGHLSRPACSHVKQLAKQAGDRSDPGRTYCSGRVFYGLISSGFSKPPEEVGMKIVNVQSIPSP